MRTVSTHTYAILEVSSAAYQEIRVALEKAGYSDQFHDKKVSGEDAEVIDMHGIALMSKDDRSRLQKAMDTDLKNYERGDS